MALPTPGIRTSRHHPSRLEIQARWGCLGPFSAADLAGEPCLVHHGGSGWAGAGAPEASGVTSPSVEGRLTSQERRQARGRVLPWGAGRGPRSQATPLQRRQRPRAQSLPRRVSELLRVAPPEGRGNSACSPRQPALGERGGGDTPGRRLRAAEINAGDGRPVINRREAGERLAGGPKGGWGRGSAGVLGRRPEVWGRQGCSSAGSGQKLQAALSPPPGAFSPVRSRARAARGAGWRRREQPVV